MNCSGHTMASIFVVNYMKKKQHFLNFGQKNHFRFIVFSLFLFRLGLLCPTLVYGGAKDSLDFWLDWACFQHLDDPQRSYVEIYWAVNRTQLSFQKESDHYAAAVYADLKIYDQGYKPVDSLHQFTSSNVTTFDEARKSGYTVPGTLGFTIGPGNYRARLEVVDIFSKKNGLREFNMSVPSLPAGQLTVSNIQLAKQISPIPSHSETELVRLFQKDGLEVVPNPSGTYGLDDNKLAFYAEIYGFALSSATLPESSLENQYVLQVAVLDTFNLLVRDYGQKAFKKPGPTAVIASSIPIENLPAGPLVLVVTVVDRATGQVAESSKRFHLIRALPAASLAFISDTISFSEAEAQGFLDLVWYIATPEELQRFKTTPENEKRQYIRQFWEKRDPDPSTPINEFLAEHLRRFLYANQLFSPSVTKKNEGWRTEMGRVYIMFGSPNSIQRGQFSQDNLAFERWDYNNVPAQGSILFIFVEDQTSGVFHLVHSTARAFIHDPKWEDKIQSERLQP